SHATATLLSYALSLHDALPIYFRQLCRRLAQDGAEQVVRLRDELHVGVLDAVVDHLHEVARAIGTDVGAARGAVDLGGDGLQDRDRKSTRLNSSHVKSSYAVFC